MVITMAKQIKIRIFPNGDIQAVTTSIKGKQCLKYITPLEELLEAKVMDSEFTKEYYDVLEQMQQDINVEEVVQNGR